MSAQLVDTTDPHPEEQFVAIAHRGAGYELPLVYTQNSLAAFGKARQQGAAGIEFDVSWTTDRHNVVFHGPNLDLEFCQPSPDPERQQMLADADVRAEELSLAEIRELCTLANGEPMPTLEEALVHTNGLFTYRFLEIKDSGKDDEEVELQTRAAIETARTTGAIDDVIFMSYHPLARGILLAEPGIQTAWDDQLGTETDEALASDAQYYGIDLGYLSSAAVSATSDAGKTMFSYSAIWPTQLNRLHRTGVRLVMTDNLSMLARYRATNPDRGEFDVGLLANGYCPLDHETIEIYTDDEDDNNANATGGWIGISASSTDTVLRFCREDGRLFRPLAGSSSAATDYAVLKLGEHCPAGAVEFSRTLDDEDIIANDNYALGDARPNISEDRTTLYFCQFKGTMDDTAAPALPSLTYWYGIFAAPEFQFGSEYGFLFIDDEDEDNHNEMTGDDVARQIIAGTENTQLNLWKR
jgi:glycerophosphoryl diester phosphodiesterase